MDTGPLVAGVELGGTKCICILGRGPNAIVDRIQLPTTSPEETLTLIERSLARWGRFDALGIASFGPISINSGSDTYGCITSTPKRGWAGTSVARRLGARFEVPTAFQTDVIGAALAEAKWGVGLADMAYITVGTGIGVGLLSRGLPVGGLTHPELGHLRPVRMMGDLWPGICSYHGDCVEGLASGPAIAARAGMAGHELANDHAVWASAAHCLGQLCQTLVLTGIPRRIIIGGGVMTGAPHLLSSIRAELARSLASYLTLPELDDLNSFVVAAGLGADAGPLGSIRLGQMALENEGGRAE